MDFSIIRDADGPPRYETMPHSRTRNFGVYMEIKVSPRRLFAGDVIKALNMLLKEIQVSKWLRRVLICSLLLTKARVVSRSSLMSTIKYIGTVTWSFTVPVPPIGGNIMLANRRWVDLSVRPARSIYFSGHFADTIPNADSIDALEALLTPSGLNLAELIGFRMPCGIVTGMDPLMDEDPFDESSSVIEGGLCERYGTNNSAVPPSAPPEDLSEGPSDDL